MNDRWLSRVLVAVASAVVALVFVTLLEAWLAPCVTHSC
jgi:hypothetical protein